MNSGKILLAGIVVILAARAIVIGIRMKALAPRVLPTGRDHEIEMQPLAWYHRMFYIVGGTAGLAAALFYIVTAVIANG
jgi:hypothetical protein